VSATLLKFEHRFQGGSACRVAVDLDAVRGNEFVPRFVWYGAKCSRRELVAWLVEVFREIADQSGLPQAFTALGESGRQERWVFWPGQEPKQSNRWMPRVFCISPPKQEAAENPWGRYVLRFGQHRGKCLREVTPQYLEWMLRSYKGLWPGTRNAIKRYLETLH
jgi:hypothetical protein